MLTLVCKSDTSIGVPVGSYSEIPEELGDDLPAMEMMCRQALRWYAQLEGADLVGPIKWKICEPMFGTVLREGEWSE